MPEKLYQLHAQKLQCSRNDTLLFSNLDIICEAHTCLHIIGANGAGKSSLLRILCGILKPDAGSISWKNKDIQNNSAYLQDMAYIGHKDGLKGSLTAIENLRHYLDATNIKPNHTQNNEEHLDNCLNKLGLLKHAETITQQLSFGQKKRLIFAKLLLKKYTVWLLDEPFTGIDSQGRSIIETCCAEHLEQGGIIALSSHQSLRESPLSPYLTELEL